LSNAKPMVGVCDAAMPPMIRAMPVLPQDLFRLSRSDARQPHMWIVA
jgi:hypothetical protein